MPRAGVELDVITIMWLLILAFISLMLVRRTRLPYTVALVIVGLIVGATHLLKAFPLSRELVFTVLLPPLLFDAAIRLPVHLLGRVWRPVVILVGPGVVASMLLVGYAVHYWVGLGLLMALQFGALISATDPVSVLTRFRSLNVDSRLSMLVEGEGLFNDGTATVLFAAMLTATVSGMPVNAGTISWDIARSIIGGVLIGGAIGWLISLIMSHINDHLAEITLTTIAAYGSTLIALSIGTSTVISVITAGIVLGYYRGEAVMSATSRAAVYSFWEYLAFAVSSILFLLIGIDVNVLRMGHYIVPMSIAIGVVIAARTLVVYLMGLSLTGSASPVPTKWLHVVNLGGLRGALAIALAYSLPRTLPGSDVVEAMTYGVVLWTLLVQGLSIGWVLNKLGLAGRRRWAEEYERIVALRQAKRASEDELETLRKEGVASRRLYEEYREKLERELKDINQRLEDYQQEHGEMLAEQRRQIEQRLLAAQQNAIRRATETGIASRDAAREVMSEIFDEYGQREEED